MSSAKILTLKNRDEWGSLLSKMPLDQQDIYYTPQYYSISENNGEGQACCFVFEENNEIALYPFLKNSINIHGFDSSETYFDIQGAYGYNGIISESYDSEFQKSFFGAFRQYCLKSRIVAEFTRFNPVLGNQRFAMAHMEVVMNRETVTLNLEKDYDHIWSECYHAKNRNTIRKGRKTLAVHRGGDSKDYKIFSDMYSYTMERLNAADSYLFPEKYFTDLQNEFNDSVNLFTAFSQSSKIPLGAILILIYKDKAHYHLSARSEMSRNNAVNNFLLDEAIQYAQNNGCKRFHLGGGLSADPKDSLFLFKKKFSNERYNFFIGKMIHDKKVYEKLCEAWESLTPDSAEINSKKILKYRL